MYRKLLKSCFACTAVASLLLPACGQGSVDSLGARAVRDDSVDAEGSIQPDGENVPTDGTTVDESPVDESPVDVDPPVGNESLGSHEFFGRASAFNVFAAADVHQWGTDIQGPLAVGGRLDLEGFGVGTTCNQSTVLVAEGEIHATAGMFYGTVVVPAETAIEATVLGEIQELDPDFSIAEIHQELITLSSRLGAERANGQVSQDLNGLHLIGSDSVRNVFSLGAGALDNLTGFRIDIPDGSYAVVNVFGETSRIAAFGFLGDETSASRVLFNFPEATDLSAEAVGIEGSILAPRAHFRFNAAHIDGQVMVTSVEGTGESHDEPFEPYPYPYPYPE